MRRLLYTIIPIVSFLVFYTTGISSATTSNESSKSTSQISGQIVDAETKEPLLGANIMIMNSFGGAIADENGNFALKNLNTGIYHIKVSHIGYENNVVSDIVIDPQSNVNLYIELTKQVVSIKGISVTPGQYTIMGNEPETKQSLNRKVIESRPQFGEDIFRAVKRLPGLSSNDFSAKFNIRGGEQDEVLVSLDGMEIYEPFHLRDIDGGVFSITDVAAMESVDLMTGGYPANYGERMSGIFNITSKNPAVDYNRTSLGLTISNIRILTEGSFANNKGSYLISARRGYMDIIFKLAGADDELKPQYYDLFSKVQYQLSNNHILKASVLHANDYLRYQGVDEDIGDTLKTSYGNSYLWLTLHSSLGPKFTARTIASIGKVKQEKFGKGFQSYQQVPGMEAHDNRSFDMQGVKSDWEYEVSSNFLIKAGFDFKHLTSDYDYMGRVYNYRYYNTDSTSIYQLENIDSIDVVLNPSGNKFGGYLSNRIRLSKPLTVELGFRYDHASYSDDKNYSPRVNLVYDFSSSTSFKFGWGHFYQLQRIDEISAGDGETEFYNSEKAEHFVASLEHTFDSGIKLRLEGFHKKYSHLRPAWRNTFSELEMFYELENDRIRVDLNGKTAKGIDIYLNKDTGGKLNWWLSYSLSKVEDDIENFYFVDEDVLWNYNKKIAYPFEQRHTVYFDVNYRPSSKWQFNMAWQYHTGWNYTDVRLESYNDNGTEIFYIQANEPWSSQHSPYNRLDLRVNKIIPTKKGTITAFIEIINLLGKKNVRNYEYSTYSINGNIYLNRDQENWFSRMPAFGIVYNFDM